MSELKSNDCGDNSEKIKEIIDNYNKKELIKLKENGSSQSDIRVESNISDIEKFIDPISAPVAIKRNDVDPQIDNDSDEPKIILSLISSSNVPSYNKKNIANETEEEKQIAQSQLEELEKQTARNRRKKQQLPDLNKLNKAKNLSNTKQSENSDVFRILEGNSEEYQIVSVVNDQLELENQNIESEEDSKDVVIIPAVNSKKSRKRKNHNIAESLINSLTLDWNDDNGKNVEMKVDSVQNKKILNKAKSLITSEATKPKRIIKKKIIWDPDAPETHFPLASLVQPVLTKRQQQSSKNSKSPPKSPSKVTPTPKEEAKTEVSAEIPKRRLEAPIILNNKKRKLSETNKLLNDEGATNKLNDKESENSVKNPVNDEVPIIKKKEIIIKKVIAPIQKKDPPIKKRNSPVVVQGGKRTKLTVVTEENVKKDNSLPKKRTPKPKQDNWDFIYNQKNIDAMIIRRRSSSYSSTTSPRRLSLEHNAPQTAQSTNIIQTKKVVGANKVGKNKKELLSVQTKKINLRNGKGFEFAKPQNKKSSEILILKKEAKKEMSNSNVTSVTKSSVRESPRKSLRVSAENTNLSTSIVEEKVNLTTKKSTSNVEIVNHGSVLQLIVHSNSESMRAFSYNSEILKELTKKLDIISNDDSCKVVVLTSNGPHFCQGIDFKPIANTNIEKRKMVLTDLIKSVNEFLKVLASFTKPIIAGIHGICFGLGVTMLPLFDIVVSSDKCIFEATYGRFGVIPEGCCVLSLTNKVNQNFKTNLLWLNEKINSKDALNAGLITKITTTDKVIDEAINFANKIAKFSSQMYIEMKKQNFNNELLNSIDNEKEVLMNQWCSEEFYNKVKVILQKGQL